MKFDDPVTERELLNAAEVLWPGQDVEYGLKDPNAMHYKAASVFAIERRKVKQLQNALRVVVLALSDELA